MLLTLTGLANAYPVDPQSIPPHETGRTWLYLRDEQIPRDELNRRLALAFQSLTPRSQARRLKTLGAPGVRLCDLPPSPERLSAIESTGCRVVRSLRYINAVIVTGSEASVARAARLAFVDSARPVMAFASMNASREFEEQRAAIRDNAADYGVALRQLGMVNVPAAHSAGFRGRGVLIGSQDTGFDNLNHNCFRFLEVIAAYDFLNDDHNVADQGDLGSGSHGTRTLSVIAGLDSGAFIGVAPDAQFVLTKTENSASETPIEEDYWIAGLWFHDSLGVDVLSSSLSYREWYDYPDFDGETAPTTRAADSAAAAGLVIVNSMGNTGGVGYPRSKLGAPADARGIISVGGAHYDSTYWTTASQGPTFDGRLKPDVAALSSGVYTASSADDNGYFSRAGTSFSCPMVAGITALMLEANSNLTPAEVMEILHLTSSQPDTPDTLLGYGIPNALAAIRLAQERSVSVQPSLPTANQLTLFPNPTNGAVILSLPAGKRLPPIYLFDPLGREIDRIDYTSSNRIILDLSRYPAGSYWIGVDGSSARIILVR